jgi:hypothetical protein
LVNNFKFEKGLELLIPYEEPVESKQAIIKEFRIDLNYYYTCPLSCFGIFISNSNMHDSLVENLEMKEMGNVIDYYDLYIYI